MVNRIALKAQNQGALSISSYENTEKPGLYIVAPEDGNPSERVYYTVTADRAESNLTRMQSSDFTHLERDVGVRVAHEMERTGTFHGTRRRRIRDFGVPDSRCMIGLCFVEVFLTRRWM